MRGSVTKKGNCYYIVLDRHRDGSSRRKQVWVSARKASRWVGRDLPPWRRKQDAESLLPDVLNYVKNEHPTHAGNLTVGEYMVRWVTNFECRQTTKELYQTIVHAYVEPGIGHYVLAELRQRHLTSFYRSLRDEGGRRGQGLSRKTTENVHACIKSALRDAHDDDLIRVNPALRAKLPRSDIHDAEAAATDEAPTPEVIQKFISVARADRLFALWVLYPALGLRRSEGVGFKWSDFDAEAGTLTVARGVVLERGSPTFRPPKSAKGHRRYDLPQELVDLLLAHRSAQAQERLKAGGAWQNSNLIFCKEDGTVLNPTWVYRKVRRMFEVIGESGNVRRLRYFFGTEFWSANVDPKVTTLLMGHATAITSLQHYNRPSTESKRAAIKGGSIRSAGCPGFGHSHWLVGGFWTGTLENALELRG